MTRQPAAAASGRQAGVALAWCEDDFNNTEHLIMRSWLAWEAGRGWVKAAK